MIKTPGDCVVVWGSMVEVVPGDSVVTGSVDVVPGGTSVVVCGGTVDVWGGTVVVLVASEVVGSGGAVV